jgi:general secretion pathway protein C
MIIANMQTTPWKPWMPRIAAFVVALVLAASVVFWVLRWPVRDSGPALPLPVAHDELPPANPGALARLLGENAAAPEAAVLPDASSRFRLTGIVALGAGRGAALVSIDGKPSRPYRIGNLLEDGWVLQSVQQRSVSLGTNSSAAQGLRLELAPRQP